jgi:hypothetical protein
LVPPILAADPSAQLRDRLLGELSGLQSSDEAANWANRNLPAKNTLTVADAQLVEDGFRIKIAALGEAQPAEPTEAAQNPNPATAKSSESLPAGPRTSRGRIAAKTIRLRDKDHRKFVSSQPCLVCGRSPADAHHLRFAQPRALGRKVSDEFTIPVCRVHHRELHRHGDEAAWWQAVQVAGSARQKALSNAWGRAGIWRAKEQSKRAQARSVYQGCNRSAQTAPGVAAAISKTRARHRITGGYRFCI